MSATGYFTEERSPIGEREPRAEGDKCACEDTAHPARGSFVLRQFDCSNSVQHGLPPVSDFADLSRMRLGLAIRWLLRHEPTEDGPLDGCEEEGADSRQRAKNQHRRKTADM